MTSANKDFKKAVARTDMHTKAYQVGQPLLSAHSYPWMVPAKFGSTHTCSDCGSRSIALSLLSHASDILISQSL